MLNIYHWTNNLISLIFFLFLILFGYLRGSEDIYGMVLQERTQVYMQTDILVFKCPSLQT